VQQFQRQHLMNGAGVVSVPFEMAAYEAFKLLPFEVWA